MAVECEEEGGKEKKNIADSIQTAAVVCELKTFNAASKFAPRGAVRERETSAADATTTSRPCSGSGHFSPVDPSRLLLLAGMPAAGEIRIQESCV